MSTRIQRSMDSPDDEIPPTRFVLFPHLPPELRRKIWAHVPQPQRVIGQLMCFRYGGIYSRSGIYSPSALADRFRAADVDLSRCLHQCQPTWNLRYAVIPRSQAIFPPLHASRESRSVWLPRYFRPPRYLSLLRPGLPGEPDKVEDDEVGELSFVQFDTPFVSYESDIFAVLDEWGRLDIEARFRHFHLSYDHFLGLDCSRIRHLGQIEASNNYSMMTAMSLHISRFQELRSFSILILAGKGGHFGFEPQFWVKLPAVLLQTLDHEVRDVSDQAIANHPFFTTLRAPPGNAVYYREYRPSLLHTRQLLAGWLWHLVYDASMLPWLIDITPLCDPSQGSSISCIAETRIDLGNRPCVHGQDEREMHPGLEIGFKLLCEGNLMRDLEEAAVFDINWPEGYGPFFHLWQEARIGSYLYGHSPDI